MSASLYERDFNVWAEETAAALRSGKFEGLDVEHIAEEIEGLARKNARELLSRLIVLIGHLLKWQYQRDGRKTGWENKNTIDTQRVEILALLEEAPSLRTRVPIDKAYAVAAKFAKRETGLPGSLFPADCPYTLDQILDDNFLPGA